MTPLTCGDWRDGGMRKHGSGQKTFADSSPAGDFELEETSSWRRLILLELLARGTSPSPKSQRDSEESRLLRDQVQECHPV